MKQSVLTMLRSLIRSWVKLTIIGFSSFSMHPFNYTYEADQRDGKTL